MEVEGALNSGWSLCLCVDGTDSFFKIERLAKDVPGITLKGLSQSSEQKYSEKSVEFSVGHHFASFFLTNLNHTHLLFFSFPKDNYRSHHEICTDLYFLKDQEGLNNFRLHI